MNSSGSGDINLVKSNNDLTNCDKLNATSQNVSDNFQGQKSSLFQNHLKELKSTVTSFILRLSQTSSAFKALTNALAEAMDPNWTEYDNVKAELLKLNSSLENYADNLSRTLSKPIDNQIKAINDIKNNENTEQPPGALSHEFQMIHQNYLSVCYETWISLLDSYLKENGTISQLVQAQKDQLVRLQSRLTQSSLASEKSELLPEVPDQTNQTDLSVQFCPMLNGKQEMKTEGSTIPVDLSSPPRSAKPQRPLRARELDAIKQLSSSSHDLTSVGLDDLYASDNSLGSDEMCGHVSPLTHEGKPSPPLDRRRVSLGSSITMNNRSDPSSISNTCLKRFRRFQRFDLSNKSAMPLPRSNAEPVFNGGNNKVTTGHLNRMVRDQQLHKPNRNDQNAMVKMVSAQSSRPREVIIRDTGRLPSPKEKRPSRIVIHKQIPGSNGPFRGWSKRPPLKSVSMESLAARPITPPKQPASNEVKIIPPLLAVPGEQVRNNAVRKRSDPKNKRRVKSDSTNKYICQVITTYPYTAQDIDELSLQLNEVVHVLPWPKDLEYERGWLFGERASDGKQGVFPANFTTFKSNGT